MPPRMRRYVCEIVQPITKNLFQLTIFTRDINERERARGKIAEIWSGKKKPRKHVKIANTNRFYAPLFSLFFFFFFANWTCHVRGLLYELISDNDVFITWYMDNCVKFYYFSLVDWHMAKENFGKYYSYIPNMVISERVDFHLANKGAKSCRYWHLDGIIYFLCGYRLIFVISSWSKFVPNWNI